MQGIPAVKAFRDGEVVSEFVGAVPKAKVEEFFDSLVPSRADELLAAGDELSLREASELEPRRSDIAVALARRRFERGADDEALEALEPHRGDFAADGIASLIELKQAGSPRPRSRRSSAATARPRSTRLLEAIADADEQTREDLRRAVIGILSDGDQADPTAREYRRRLATALY